MSSAGAATIECFTFDDQRWVSMLPAAVVMLVVYVVGVPLALTAVLVVGYELSTKGKPVRLFGRWVVASGRGMLDSHFKEMFGPLYNGYHRRSCVWEAVIMTRKISIVAVRVAFVGWLTAQIMLTTLIVTIALLQLKYSLYLSRLELSRVGLAVEYPVRRLRFDGRSASRSDLRRRRRGRRQAPLSAASSPSPSSPSAWRPTLRGAVQHRRGGRHLLPSCGEGDGEATAASAAAAAR